MWTYISRRPGRPEALIETSAQPFDVGTFVRVVGEQPVLRGCALVDPGEDFRRIAEHAVGGHEDRDRGSAAGTAGCDSVDALDVALLAVWDSGPLESPAHLLAVVADRDRDEPQHPREHRSRALALSGIAVRHERGRSRLGVVVRTTRQATSTPGDGGP